jgi:hypothetical protein
MQTIFPPLDLTDASILLAVSAILLLVTSQISPAYNGITDITIDKKRLDIAAMITGAMFLATVVIRVISFIRGV